MRACQECKTHVRRRQRAFSGRLLCPDCWFAAEVYARDDRDVTGPSYSNTASAFGPVDFEANGNTYVPQPETAPPRFRAALRWNCDVEVYSA